MFDFGRQGADTYCIASAKSWPIFTVILSEAPAEILLCLHLALLRSSISLCSTQDDGGGAQSKSDQREDQARSERLESRKNSCVT